MRLETEMRTARVSWAQRVHAGQVCQKKSQDWRKWIPRSLSCTGWSDLGRLPKSAAEYPLHGHSIVVEEVEVDPP